jgi:Subtilase family
VPFVDDKPDRRSHRPSSLDVRDSTGRGRSVGDAIRDRSSGQCRFGHRDRRNPFGRRTTGAKTATHRPGGRHLDESAIHVVTIGAKASSHRFHRAHSCVRSTANSEWRAVWRTDDGSNALAASIAAEKRVVTYLSQADVMIVASAGNSSLDLTGRVVHLPGDTPGMVNVAATGIRPLPRFPQAGTFDVPASYSNYGAPISVAAPGGDAGPVECCEQDPSEPLEYLVLSTAVYPDPWCAVNADCPVGYEWKGGTSMAARARRRNGGLDP